MRAAPSKSVTYTKGAEQIAKHTAKEAATEGAEKVVKKNIPKPPRGKGKVSPADRDPKRAYSKKEKAEMLDDQGGKCAQCGTEKTVDQVDGHHIERHADGGATTKENGASVCKDCHKELHEKE